MLRRGRCPEANGSLRFTGGIVRVDFASHRNAVILSQATAFL